MKKYLEPNGLLVFEMGYDMTQNLSNVNRVFLILYDLRFYLQVL